MTPVSFHLLTGGLGSGKTTLLSRLLRNGLKGRRPAVLLNELGPVTIDGPYLRGLGTDLRELPSGCVCCQTSRELRGLVARILEESKPDLVILETSGAAFPEPILYGLADSGLTLDGVVTVVDAANLPRLLEASEAPLAQIQSADVVLLNKTDLVPESILGQREAYLRNENPRAPILRTVQADADLDALFAPRRLRSAQDLQQWAKSVGGKAVTRLSHLRSERLESFAVETDGTFDVDRLRAYLRGLPREIFRVKGFVRLAGKVGFAFVNQIGDRVRVFEEVALEPPPRRNVLVFIGTEAGDSRDTIARGLSTLLTKGA